MSGILDEFVVAVGLDASAYTKGRKQVEEDFKRTKDSAKKTADELEASGKQGAAFFSQLRGNVIALFAAFTAGKGIKEFIGDLVTTDIAIARTSQAMDLSVETLSEWRNAAVSMGGSADGITQSLGGLSQDLQQLSLTGESKVIPFFRRLRINIYDGNMQLKTASELFLETADAVKGMDKAYASTLLTGMGMDSASIYLLFQGREAIEKMVASKKGLAPTPADIQAAKEYQEKWADLQQTSTRAGQTLLTLVAPALEAILDGLTAVATFLNEHKAILVGVFTALTVAVLALSAAMAVNFASVAVGAMTAGFGLITGGIVNLLVWLGALTEVALPALAEAFLAVGLAIEATPVGWIITGIAAIAAAAYWLYEHWDGVKNWWHNLWQSMGDDVDAARQRAEPHGAVETILSSFGIGGVQNRPTSASTVPSGATADPRSAKGQAWVAAKASEAKYGIPAQVTFAQWALESNYGRNIPAGSNNPFGIKARAGDPYVEASTTEVVNGQAQRVIARFAKFASLGAAFEAHARLLATAPQYAAARAQEGNGGAFADALTGVYATDPNYGSKLKTIMAANSSSSTRTVNIDTIVVHTQAQTADGIASSIGQALRRNSFATMANSGQG